MKAIASLWGDQRVRTWALFAAALAACAITLWPTLTTGFMGDDAVNSLVTHAALSAQNTGLWQFIGGQIGGWARLGRFFPLSNYTFVLYWLVNGNLALYKAICLAAILGDIALFGVLVMQLSGSRGLGIATMTLMPVLMANTDFHDALVSYATLLQVDFALVTGALLLLLLYLRKGGPWRYWVSVALFSAALLTYEIAASLVFLFGIAAWLYVKRRTGREVLRLWAPYLVAVGVAVAITFVLRLVFGQHVLAAQQSETYSLSLSPLPVLGAFVKQLVGALPLSFAIARGSALTLSSRQPFASLGYFLRAYPVTSLLVFVCVGGASALAWLLVVRHLSAASKPARRKARRSGNSVESSVPIGLLFAIGVAYVVPPAALLSLSPRWQRDLYWGVGYLAVYIEWFGMALVIVAAAFWLVRRLRQPTTRRVAIAILSITIGLAAVVTFQDNRVLIEFDNLSWNYPRLALETGLRGGLLGDVSARDVVLTDVDHPFAVPDFMTFYGGHRPAAVEPLSGFTPDTARTLGMVSGQTSNGAGYLAQGNGPGVWYLTGYSTAPGNGVFAMTRVISMTFNGSSPATAVVEPVRAFAYDSPATWRHLDAPWDPALALRTPPQLGSFVPSGTQRQVIAGDGTWSVYQFSGKDVIQVVAPPN